MSVLHMAYTLPYKSARKSENISSFDRFLEWQGLNVTQSTPAHALHFLQHHGCTYSIWDYWCTKDREAWWNAVKWTKVAQQSTLTLHQRCSAVRIARTHWRIFLQRTTPWQPLVPPLPE